MAQIHRHVQSRQGAAAIAELLEHRRLLSLTVDLRLANGNTSIDVSTVGQVVNLQIWAEVTDAQNEPTLDGLIDLDASFLSTAAAPGAVAGNLASRVSSDFKGDGYQNGASQDLNGDGNLDVGGTNPNSLNGYFLRGTSTPPTTTPPPSMTPAATASSLATPSSFSLER